jgi:hypothetical protein
MDDQPKPSPVAPMTEESFVADRKRFWGSATKFATYVAGAIVVLLLILWYWLV